MSWITLKGPEGQIHVDGAKAIAVSECKRLGVNNTTVRSQVWFDGSSDPINTTEHHEEVLAKLRGQDSRPSLAQPAK